MSWLGGIYPVLLVTAAAMSAINLYVLARFVPRSGGPPNLARAIVVGYVLVASSVFWIVLPWALLAPDLTSYYTVLTLMSLPMPAPFVFLMAALFRAEEKQIAPSSASWAILVAGALVANELFMSLSFAVAIAGYSGDLAGLFGTSLNAVWFAAPMLATMALLIALVPMTPFERRGFAGVAATVAVGPLLLISPVAGAIGMGALMTVVLVVLAVGVRGPRRLTVSEGSVAIGVTVGFVAMAAAAVTSIVVPGTGGSALPYGVASLGVMLAEGWVLIRRGLWDSSGRASPAPEGALGSAPTPVA